MPCEVFNIENDGGYLFFGIEDAGDTMYGRTCNVTLKWLLPNTAVKEITFFDSDQIIRKLEKYFIYSFPNVDCQII